MTAPAIVAPTSTAASAITPARAPALGGNVVRARIPIAEMITANTASSAAGDVEGVFEVSSSPACGGEVTSGVQHGRGSYRM